MNAFVPLKRECNRRRGTDQVSGYEYTLRTENETLELVMSASRELLSSRGISADEERYRALCREVARRTQDTSVMMQIKENWLGNNRQCFALMRMGSSSPSEEVVVTYGATWEKPIGWGPPKVLWIPVSQKKGQ